MAYSKEVVAQDLSKEIKFAGTYAVKLLFKEKVTKPIGEVFVQRLSKKLGSIHTLMESDNLSSYVIEDYKVIYQDEKAMPSQMVIFDTQSFNAKELDVMIRSQCWACENIDELLEDCKYELMITDMMASGLEIKERTHIIAQFVDVLLEVMPSCKAVYFPHSQKIVPRENFLESSWSRPELHFLDGGVNVRFFTIQGTDDCIVDTLGLYALGLSDIQCHFNTLDHNEVIHNIHNLVAYLYEYGDIINDGETVEGLVPGEKWLCRHEDAMIQPMRVVLDINVGEYAAGNR